MSLSDVCLIIDFDGFFINKKFHVREMGFISLTSPWDRGCYRFSLGHLAEQATHKDWKTINHCTKFIHGLTLERWPGEDVYSDQSLKLIVQEEYRKAATDEKYLVAYKGGHVEKDILEELDIPCVNLENFGCPKFEHLRHPLKSVVRDCGYHKKLKNGDTAHCARVECFFFSEWVNDQLKL